jgi:hypothetical protein
MELHLGVSLTRVNKEPYRKLSLQYGDERADFLMNYGQAII